MKKVLIGLLLTAVAFPLLASSGSAESEPFVFTSLPEGVAVMGALQLELPLLGADSLQFSVDGEEVFSVTGGVKTSWSPKTLGLQTLVYTAGETTLTRNLYLLDDSVTDLVIPEGVTSIADRAFEGCSGLTSVTIPSSVTSIGVSAFEGCSGLTSVTIPSSVTSIGDNAFSGVAPTALTAACLPSGMLKDNLTTLIIPEGAKTIDDNAFSGCSGLTSVTIPSSMTSIGTNAFSGVAPTTLVAVWLPSGMSSENLTSVTIPEGVTSIGANAFSGCSGLTSVTIPSSVTSIGYLAFDGVAPTTLTAAWLPSGMSKDNLTTLTIPEGVISIPANAFSGCSNLTSVTIPSSVTSIGNNAFSGVAPTTLTAAWLPSGMSKDNLKALIIPEGATSINNNVFNGCASLTSVTIPSSVTSIGDSAFCDCSSLTSFIVDENNEVYCAINGLLCSKDGKTLLAVPEALTSATIPSSVTSINPSAFSGCTNLYKDVNGVQYESEAKVVLIDVPDAIEGYFKIPNSVCFIYSSAFSGCSGLTSVTIPEGVTSIGNYAFEGCSGLTSVTIPSSVTSIGNNAFEGVAPQTLTAVKFPNCGMSKDNLETLIIPEGAKTIDDNAFSGCSGLTSVTIPSSVTSIGTNAFSGVAPTTLVAVWLPSGMSSENLTSVTIPEGVTSIGANAFSGCSGLTSVTIPSSVTSIGANAFSGVAPTTLVAVWLPSGMSSENLTSVTIPEGVTSIGANAFSGCSGLTSVTIPSSVTSIGSNAFAGVAPEKLDSPFEGTTGGMSLENVTEVTYLEGVAFIPDDAFKGNTKLTSMVIPSTVTSIGARAFYGCSALESIVIPEGVTMIGDDAFWNCSQVASFALPTTIKTIGARAFTGCERVDVADGCRFYRSEEGVLFTADNEWLLHYPKSREGSYVTPLQVHMVGEEAFMGCTGLTAVQLMDITSIEPKAFKDCNVLARCLVSDGLLTIQGQAFENAVELHYFTMPASVISLTKTAFKNCPKLDVVSFKGNPPTVVNRASDAEDYHADETVFSGSDYDQLIGTYPIECKSAWESTEILSSTLMWQGLKMVCDSYYDAEADGYYYQVYGGEATITGTVVPLTGEVVLPSLLGGYLVTGIGEGAFMECTEMTAVTLPASIQTLGDYAFYFCDALKTVHFEGYPITKGLQAESPFPDNTTAIGYYPSTLKSNWTAVIQANKWYGLTMKAYGTILRQVSAVIYGDGVVTGTGVYPNSKTVTVTAVPAEGFRFLGWDGDVVGNNPELTLTLTEDVILKAFFVKSSIVSEFVSQENAANGVVTPEVLEELRQQYVADAIATGEVVAKAVHETEVAQARTAGGEAAIESALANKELFTSDSIQEMGEMVFDTPVIAVKQDAIEIGIHLKTAETLGANWKAMALKNAVLTIDEQTGEIRISVSKPEASSANFYKFVVDKQSSQSESAE